MSDVYVLRRMNNGKPEYMGSTGAWGSMRLAQRHAVRLWKAEPGERTVKLRVKPHDHGECHTVHKTIATEKAAELQVCRGIIGGVRSALRAYYDEEAIHAVERTLFDLAAAQSQLREAAAELLDLRSILRLSTGDDLKDEVRLMVGERSRALGDLADERAKHRAWCDDWVRERDEAAAVTAKLKAAEEALTSLRAAHAKQGHELLARKPDSLDERISLRGRLAAAKEALRGAYTGGYFSQGQMDDVKREIADTKHKLTEANRRAWKAEADLAGMPKIKADLLATEKALAIMTEAWKEEETKLRTMRQRIRLVASDVGRVGA